MNRQIDRKADIHTHSLTNRKTDGLTGRHTFRQRHTDILRDIQRGRHTDRQTNRWTVSCADKYTDRQTYWATDR